MVIRSHLLVVDNTPVYQDMQALEATSMLQLREGCSNVSEELHANSTHGGVLQIWSKR